MPPRAYWKGHLKFSLISIPVRLYSAANSAAKVSLNQIHKPTMQRVRYRNFAGDEEVDRSEIVKGYEYEKGKYVLFDGGELDHIALETTKTIEIIQFFGAAELDPIYLNAPYFMAPDGPVAEEPFSVIREALGEAERQALGRVVLSGREHLVALGPKESGFLMTTLRYAEEIRSCSGYFEEIGDNEANPDQMQMARQLIEQMTRPLDLSAFSDRYQEALLALVKSKLEGGEPELVQEEQVAQAFSFVEALKQSVEATAGAKASTKKGVKKPRAKSVRTKAGARKKKQA